MANKATTKRSEGRKAGAGLLATIALAGLLLGNAAGRATQQPQAAAQTAAIGAKA